MSLPRQTSAPRQAGSATLLIALMLLVGAGILTYAAARTGVVEQRIASNEYRAKEVHQAAQAGLEYAQAWLSRHVWTAGQTPPTPPAIVAESGERYATRLTLRQTPKGICVGAESRGGPGQTLRAQVHECFVQQGLFDAMPATRMPPPLVLAGCMDDPDAAAAVRLLEPSTLGALSGQRATADCLPQGALEVSAWRDDNANGFQEADEEGATRAYRRAAFSGCSNDHCAWRQVFAMSIEKAVQLASDAGHRYAERIPCGPAEPPGIYLIETAGPIETIDIQGSCSGTAGVDNWTIGAPGRPVLLIVPSRYGCPILEAGVSLYGILYYESETACADQALGGARIQGAVIWEGNTAGPAASAQLIETDYGSGSALSTAYQAIAGATRIPGSWRDW